MHPENVDIMLAGCASGGIFKTVDGGLNWYPVFDEFSFLAISHIIYDPVNDDILYAGTGDANISGFPFIGDGIYKSTDGGESWTHIGLTEQCIVSKIIVHPTNNNIIYAATMGLPFERNEDRGLYKSEDAGETWEQVLFVSDQAGIIDIVCDPDDPDQIFAASWDRIRNNHETVVYGEHANIYFSTNGGVSWTILSSGLPAGEQSRISIEMHPENHDILYASYVGTDLNLNGIYKTINSGTTWSELPTSELDGAMGGFGWYFDAVQINPFNADELFFLGVEIYSTTDDGNEWDYIDDFNVHADKHAMHFLSAENYILATDGGFLVTGTAVGEVN